MAIPTPILELFENLINHAIALDSEIDTKLKPLHDKTLKITIIDTKTNIYIHIEEGKIKLLGEYTGKVHTHITGRAFALLQLLINKDLTGDSSDREVTLSGDIELMQEAKIIAKQLDIDWEEHVSKYTGDIAARQLSRVAKHAKDFFQQAKKSIIDNILEYTHYESNLLITKTESEQFYSKISTLKNDVERLEKRIERLR